jgi:hypothetical protein
VSRTGPRLAAAALTATLALAANACDDSGATGAPTPETSDSAPSTSTSSGPSDDTSTEAGDPPESAAPTVAPATGIELKQTVVALRAPAGWKPHEALVDYASVARGPGSFDSLMLVDRPSFSELDSIETLYDSYVRLNEANKDLHYERRPDVDLSGTAASVVFSTTKGIGSQDYEITAVHGGRVISLILRLDKKTLAQDPQLVESVLASLRWLD